MEILPDFPPDGKENTARFQAYSMQDLHDMDLRVEYIFDGALVAGVPCVIGARQKSLKSLIALDCALSMATRTPWLGHFACVRSARCSYFCGEGGLIFAKDGLRRICNAKHLDFKDVHGLQICDAVPSLTNEVEVREALAVVRDHKATFAFFDPLYLMVADQAAQASNVFAMGSLFQRLLRACQDEGVTPVVIHHFRKGQADGQEPDLTDLAQAGCAEFAGQWILINRQRPYNEEHPGEHDLSLRLGARTGHASKWSLHVSEGSISSPGGRYWRPQISSISEARKRRELEKKAALEKGQREQLEEHSAKILAAMVGLGRATKSSIRDHAGISTKYFTPALTQLIQTGRIVPCEVTKGNRDKPYEGFMLAP